jgi:steroid delta-isomerase-like uncharacterized protein
MRGEELKAIARREVEEIFTAGDLAVVDELYAADYIGHDPTRPEPIRGPAGVKEQVSGYRTAFPDLQLTADEIVAEGDLVVTRWTATGTHEGELFGVTPTGRQVTATGISIIRVAGGKIVEDWTSWDALGLMQQLGALPAPTTA